MKELNLSWLWLTGLNFFVENMTQRIELFFQFDSKNCSFLFFHDSNFWNLFTWLKELNFLFCVTQILELLWIYFSKKWTLFFQDSKFFHQKKISPRIDFFFWIPTHRIDFFCEKNRLNSWIWRKELNRLISWIWRKDLNPFFKISLKELVFFKDSKNWTLFGSMPQRS